MKSTLEFTIPDGYELDKENSTGSKLVYKKKDEYHPKEGDLVVFSCIDIYEKEYMGIWGCDPSITPCMFKSRLTCYQWLFLDHSANIKGHIIRPATSEEAEVFTRRLYDNGYEYDPVKKEVRKKRWRAEKGQKYYYVDDLFMWDNCRIENYCLIDDTRYHFGNYFRTREEAEEVAAEFRKILNNKKV